MFLHMRYTYWFVLSMTHYYASSYGAVSWLCIKLWCCIHGVRMHQGFYWIRILYIYIWVCTIRKGNGCFCHQVRCICSPSIGIARRRHILLGLLISDIRITFTCNVVIIPFDIMWAVLWLNDTAHFNLISLNVCILGIYIY